MTGISDEGSKIARLKWDWVGHVNLMKPKCGQMLSLLGCMRMESNSQEVRERIGRTF